MKKLRAAIFTVFLLAVFMIIPATVSAKSEEPDYGTATSSSVKTYSIRYYLNGGVNSKKNPKSYTKKSNTIILASPTRKGYIFQGWYRDSKFTRKATKIPKGSTGNRVFYAKWKAIRYNIQFVGNGATSGKMGRMLNIPYGKKVTLLKNQFKRTGYTFRGWALSKNGAVKYANGQSIKNLTVKNGRTLTFYAVWKKNPNPNPEKTYTANFISSITGAKQYFPFTYSDAYFKNNSSKFSWRLAKASIALSSAAYSSGYSSTLLQQMGFTNIMQVNYNRTATATDNDFVAFSIARKSITLNGAKKNLIVVALRGTPGDYEWISNFNIGKNGYHDGFYKAAKDAKAKVLDYLKTGNASTNILWITGHSRGGAVANILETSIIEGYGNYVKRGNVYGYNFGVPYVNTKANTSLDNINNFCNPGDIAAQIPLAKWGFRRNGINIKLSAAGSAVAKFRALTGVNYKGYTSTTPLVSSLANWCSGVNDLYAVRAVDGYGLMSKHDVLDALAIMLMKNRSSSDTQRALKILQAAMYSEEIGLPEGLINMFLGSGTEAALKSSEPAIGYASSIGVGDEIAHSHSQEFYYAWTSSMIS